MEYLYCFIKCMFFLFNLKLLSYKVVAVLYIQILKNRDGYLNLNLRSEVTKCNISFGWLHFAMEAL